MNYVNSTEPKYRVQVLDRAFLLFDLFSAENEPLSLVELCKRTELTKSTAHRLVKILQQHGFLEKDPRTERYSLGIKFIELAERQKKDQAGSITKNVIRDLARQAGQPARLGILQAIGDVSVIYSSYPREAGTAKSNPRLAMPLHCSALGKVMAAFDPPFCEYSLPYHRFVPYTSKSITDMARFRAELRRVQGCGFAVDNEEIEEGFRCVAAPIWNASGAQVIAAVSVSIPALSRDEPRFRNVVKAVIAAARRISQSADAASFIANAKLRARHASERAEPIEV